ncbi:hypothetical protein CK203_012564 [Vitis vinifera]|uniref:Uncharacterized protein n=1 Tax=Vitis vinifera TaxID=29760 RepID=A0A438KMP7_VITVI|nr:hypothetical protein CK203_012564 [Vitis vinifera]
MMQLSQCTWTFPELLKRPAFLRRSIDSISSRSRSSSKYPSFMASASTVSAPNTEAEQTHNPLNLYRDTSLRTIIYILLWWMVMSTLPITLLTPTWTYLSMVSEASNCAGAFCTSRALLGFCVIANLIMHC